ncbi:MAG: hypothetical protein K6G22_11945 [Lachnospiraceae bacterium]|nr:hypothetical protein [Lachnospiraceae bacterium]
MTDVRVKIFMRKIKYWLPVIPAAIFAILIYLYRARYIMPLWAPFYDKESDHLIVNDMQEKNGIDEYHIVLKNKNLSVEDMSLSKTYVFEKAYRVEDYIVGDIDRDGKEELIILFMKRGSYGPYRPMWEEKDEKTWSQHIGIYEFGFGNISPRGINDRYIAKKTGNKDGDSIVKSKWVSSKIGMDITGIALNEDKTLTVLERDGSESRWYYGAFGLVRMDQ